MRTPVDQAPPLPAPRGPLTEWLCRVLTRDPDDVASPGHRLHKAVAAIPDTTTDDDAQLALHCIYELSYRGFAGVDDAWEWAPPLLELRRALEARFERDLRAAVDRSDLTAGATTVAEVLGRAERPLALGAHGPGGHPGRVRRVLRAPLGVPTEGGRPPLVGTAPAQRAPQGGARRDPGRRVRQRPGRRRPTPTCSPTSSPRSGSTPPTAPTSMPSPRSPSPPTTW